jgi:DNA-binding MarR family transcriptional regulator
MPESFGKLSQLQRKILLWIGEVRQRTRLVDVPWTPSHGLYPMAEHPHWTPADRAVVSRALRRLEQRGLLRRTNARTTHVRLTSRGGKVLKRLAAATGEPQGLKTAHTDSRPDPRRSNG